MFLKGQKHPQDRIETGALQEVWHFRKPLKRVRESERTGERDRERDMVNKSEICIKNDLLLTFKTNPIYFLNAWSLSYCE